jgi:hypothetical protein
MPISSTFALVIISVVFISIPCTNDRVSLLCASSDGSTSLKQINTQPTLVKPQLNTSMFELGPVE